MGSEQVIAQAPRGHTRIRQLGAEKDTRGFFFAKRLDDHEVAGI